MQQTPIYKFKKRELTDSPPDITATNGNWDINEDELKKQSDQITVLSTNKADKNNAAFTGTMKLNSKDVATTEKTEILCTANPGYTIVNQRCYKVNNIAYYNVEINKTDNTDFIANNQIAVAKMPTGSYVTTMQTELSGHIRTSGATGSFCSICLYGDGNIYAMPSVNGKTIQFSGVYIL